MDFKQHVQILRMCYTKNITKRVLIRQIYDLIKEHEGKDFKDIDDLLSTLYPPRLVERVPAGVNIRHRGHRGRRRR